MKMDGKITGLAAGAVVAILAVEPLTLMANWLASLSAAAREQSLARPAKRNITVSNQSGRKKKSRN